MPWKLSRRGAKLSDQPHNFLKQIARRCDLGRPQDDVPGARGHLGGDLAELLPEVGHQCEPMAITFGTFLIPWLLCIGLRA